ncbi:transcriptional repressor TraM [Bradyrhizobium sp. USDA 336]|uniref:transcriptional repressor TraM n=1 Tax=Bradyrhizobium sp. USDA 336 TaxID=3156311 RepID=UPI00384AE7EE
MAQPELERLTVDAVREYRASVALAETARLQRVAAEADTDTVVPSAGRSSNESMNMQRRSIGRVSSS